MFNVIGKLVQKFITGGKEDLYSITDVSVCSNVSPFLGDLGSFVVISETKTTIYSSVQLCQCPIPCFLRDFQDVYIACSTVNY